MFKDALSKYRYLVFLVLIICIPLLEIASDPNQGWIDNLPFGASLLGYLILLGRAIIAVFAFHFVITLLFNSIGFDLKYQADQAGDDHRPFYAIAYALVVVAFAMIVAAVLSL